MPTASGQHFKEATPSRRRPARHAGEADARLLQGAGDECHDRRSRTHAAFHAVPSHDDFIRGKSRRALVPLNRRGHVRPHNAKVLPPPPLSVGDCGFASHTLLFSWLMMFRLRAFDARRLGQRAKLAPFSTMICCRWPMPLARLMPKRDSCRCGFFTAPGMLCYLGRVEISLRCRADDIFRSRP